MEKKGWKVCRDAETVGIRSFSFLLEGRLRYGIGETTFPFYGNGPLAVFRTKKAALDAWPGAFGKKVFRCIYLPWKGEREMWEGSRRVNFWTICTDNNLDASKCDLASWVRLEKEVK